MAESITNGGNGSSYLFKCYILITIPDQLWKGTMGETDGGGYNNQLNNEGKELPIMRKSNKKHYTQKETKQVASLKKISDIYSLPSSILGQNINAANNSIL